MKGVRQQGFPEQILMELSPPVIAWGPRAGEVLHLLSVLVEQGWQDYLWNSVLVVALRSFSKGQIYSPIGIKKCNKNAVYGVDQKCACCTH